MTNAKRPNWARLQGPADVPAPLIRVVISAGVPRYRGCFGPRRGPVPVRPASLPGTVLSGGGSAGPRALMPGHGIALRRPERVSGKWATALRRGVVGLGLLAPLRMVFRAGPGPRRGRFPESLLGMTFRGLSDSSRTSRSTPGNWGASGGS